MVLTGQRLALLLLACLALIIALTVFLPSDVYFPFDVQLTNDTLYVVYHTENNDVILVPWQTFLVHDQEVIWHVSDPKWQTRNHFKVWSRTDCIIMFMLLWFGLGILLAVSIVVFGSEIVRLWRTRSEILREVRHFIPRPVLPFSRKEKIHVLEQ